MTQKSRSREVLPLLGPSGPHNRAATAPGEDEPDAPDAGHLALETRPPFRWPGRAAFCVGGLILLYLLVRVSQLTGHDLWAPEGTGIIAARRRWPGVLRYLLLNLEHPPLFLVVLKLWIKALGEELLYLRLLPWLAAAATAAPLVLLGRALRMRLVEILTALFLIAVNGYLVFHAQEVRPYSLALFFATASLWLFVTWLNASRREAWYLAGLLLSNALLVYTHHFGWFLVAAEALYVLIWARERLRSYAAATLLVFLAFLPWVYLVGSGPRAREPLSFLARTFPPGPRALLHWYESLHGALPLRGGLVLALVIFAVPVAWFGWQAFRRQGAESRRERRVFSFLLLASLLPVAAAFLGRIGGYGLWGERFLIVSAIPWLFLVAISLHRIPVPARLRMVWVGVALLAAGWAGWSDLRTQRLAWEGELVGSRVAWNSLGRRMWDAEGPTEKVRVYVLNGQSVSAKIGYWPVTDSFLYYLQPLAPLADYRFAFWSTDNLRGILAAKPPVEHFWVAFFETPQWQQRRPDEWLAGQGFRIGERIRSGPGRNGLVLFPAWRNDSAGKPAS